MKKKAPEGISIVDMKKNKGKAAAVRAGSRYLFSIKDIRYIGFIDADLSTDFNELKNLVESLDSNNNLIMVFGSRGKGNGNIKRNAFRSLFSVIINKIITLGILGLPIDDTQCGAKVFRRAIVPTIFTDGFLSRWLFDLEIFIRLKNHFGKDSVMTRIYSYSLQRWVHVDDSKLGLRDSIKIPLMLFKIWFSYSVLQSLNLIKENIFETTANAEII